VKGGAVRVLLADDSDLFAEEVRRVIEADPRIHVVGRARNGEQAVALTAQLRPDLVIMDVLMPVMDGLAAIQKIMAYHPTPILVMTGDPRGASGELALEATRRGALDLVMKAPAYPSAEQEEALRSRVRFLASVPVVRHQDASRRTPRAARPLDAAPAGARIGVIGLVASTGGPAALATLMEDLPASLGAGIVVVQHLPGGFAESLAEWLGNVCAFRVKVARGGEVLGPGQVLVAPDNQHLTVHAGGRVVLTQDPPRNGFRPAGDVLLGSLARSHGPEALGIVMTGIGTDGSQGLLELRRAGGRTLAQDEATSLIFGMPQAAWSCGAAERLVGLPDMADAMSAIVGGAGR
jgi:two-component system chemotaxis response regulator CheB